MKFTALLTFTLPVLFFQSCAKMQLSEIAAPSSAALTSSAQCFTTLVNTTRKVNVVLLVDASGSNVSNEMTDPNKIWRAAAINDLVNRYGTKTNFYFSIITFQGTTAKAQITSAQGQAIFSNQQSEIQNGISNFMSNPDSGSTPYKAALTAAKNLISQDLIDHPGDNALYTVALISDGEPKDYTNPDQIIPDANAIVSLAPSRITLNGVYYYNAASQMAGANTQYLKNLATVGKGSFVTANSSQSLQVDDIMQVQQDTCQ